jgi:hypothetical protein
MNPRTGATPFVGLAALLLITALLVYLTGFMAYLAGGAPLDSAIRWSSG